MISVNDRVAIAEPQLHNGASVLSEGHVVAMHGQRAEVAFVGEASTRMVPVSQLSATDTLFGNQHFRHNQMPVVDAIRR